MTLRILFCSFDELFLLLLLFVSSLMIMVYLDRQQDIALINRQLRTHCCRNVSLLMKIFFSFSETIEFLSALIRNRCRDIQMHCLVNIRSITSDRSLHFLMIMFVLRDFLDYQMCSWSISSKDVFSFSSFGSHFTKTSFDFRTFFSLNNGDE